VDENGAHCTCREITVGLDAWMLGWDGVGCMHQHGVGTGLGIMTAGTGWGKYLKNSAGLGWGWGLVGMGITW